jgi:hypothetical protein
MCPPVLVGDKSAVAVGLDVILRPRIGTLSLARGQLREIRIDVGVWIRIISVVDSREIPVRDRGQVSLAGQRCTSLGENVDGFKRSVSIGSDGTLMDV